MQTTTSFSQSFLQSPEWEEFQHTLGRKTWRVEKNLVIQHALGHGLNYLYSPRPRVLDSDSWYKALHNIARQERSIFLKIDPERETTRPHDSRLSSSTQPQRTIFVDVSKTEAELLSSMHEKTRYNIRLAARSGVVIQKISNGDGRMVEDFWNILQETANRQGFFTHERRHYEALLSLESSLFSNELFCALHEGKMISAALINFYAPSGRATYLHGASTHAFRALMAPHLLHWTIAEETKKRGLWFYDLGGIDEIRWPGVTRFKSGFGGHRVEYPASFDIIYRRMMYNLYHLTKRA